MAAEALDDATAPPKSTTSIVKKSVKRRRNMRRTPFLRSERTSAFFAHESNVCQDPSFSTTTKKAPIKAPVR